MSDLAVLMKQHTLTGEGLAALQMLTSNLPDAVMVSSTKDHNLCFGNADLCQAIGLLNLKVCTAFAIAFATIVIHRQWPCMASFVPTDEVPESRALSGTVGRDVDANPGADAYPAMHSATIPHLAGQLRQLHLRRQKPRRAQPGVTKQAT